MACCCVNTLNLCDVIVCDEAFIRTGADAPATGNYKLVLDYLDIKIVLNADIIATEEIIFPAGTLNESYTYRGKLFGPDTLPMTITVDTVVYDCISFHTVQQFTLVPAAE